MSKQHAIGDHAIPLLLACPSRNVATMNAGTFVKLMHEGVRSRHGADSKVAGLRIFVKVAAWKLL